MSLRAPERLPLLAASGDSPLAVRACRTVSATEFLVHVERVARRLPAAAHLVNLCDDRYLFTVAFAAAAVSGRSSLLPASRAAGAVAETEACYPGSHRLADADVASWIGAATAEEGGGAVPQIPAEQVVAVPFTSGSTGRSQPHPKRWGELVVGARLAERRFRFRADGPAGIVATVPPQHMYGLETSVMLPLVVGVLVHGGRPLFPDDVRDALAAVPAPRVLVTTPAHLRVCVEADLRWPPLAMLISATAPLSRAVAAACESAMATRVMEIYGFTEAGSVASRRTVTDDEWTTYDGFRLDADGWFRAEHLPQPLRPGDVVDVRGPTRFALAGREADLVNIAGKRTSLAYLNQMLTDIDGVEDGVFLVPPGDHERPSRLTAIAVAPGRTREQVLDALAARIDPLFLPRPLVLVAALPRSETGKLRRDALADLFDRTGSGDR